MGLFKRLSLKNKNVNVHRIGLIDLYSEQLCEAGPFMSVVLTEALRKLRETTINPTLIEDWVIKLEKTWVEFV